MPTNPTKLVADLERGERSFTITMFAYLFLVTATFWILKPLKKALFIQYYDAKGLTLGGWHLEAAEAELIAKLLNMLVAIVAVAVFTWVARRLRRQALSMAFAGAFVVAFALYTIVLAHPGDASVWSFYLFGDLFSTIMVGAFFAFLNDSVSPEAAKRLYGPIVAGGVGGGVFGALVLSTWIERLTPPQWLGVCCIMGAAIGGMAWLAGRAHRGLPAASRSVERAAAPAPARNPRDRGRVARVPLPLPPRRRRDRHALRDRVDRHGLPVHEHRRALFRRSGDREASVTRVRDHEHRVAARAVVPDERRHEPLRRRHGASRAARRPRSGRRRHSSAAPTAVAREPPQHGRQRLQLLDQPVGEGGALHADDADEKYAAKAFIDMFGQRFAKTIGVGASLAMSQWFHDFASVRWLSLVSIAGDQPSGPAPPATRAGRSASAPKGASEPDEHPSPLVPGRDREAHALRGR
jgi:AAA family ATP:ADP antiporter